MSEKSELELRVHLVTKTRPKLRPETIDKLVNGINDVRCGIIDPKESAFAEISGVKWWDVLESYNCFFFLTDETDNTKRLEWLRNLSK